MKAFFRFLIVLLIIAVVIGLCGLISYNGLIRKDETVKQTWSDIDTQLQRVYLSQVLHYLISEQKKHFANLLCNY